MAKSWELTPQEKNRMRDKHLYNKFIMQQEDEFVRIMEFINEQINRMIESREITNYTQLRARIKSEKSAIHNDSIKTVDDVFGMEIITATEQEYKKVIEEIKKYMNVSPYKKINNIDKPNGYKATHLTMILKKEALKDVGIPEEDFEEVPLIEFQFKTLEVMIKASIGEAAHTRYKRENLEEVQRKYDAGEYDDEKSGFYELPTMWKSENGKMRLLDTEEVLEAMYPYLKTKSKQRTENKGEEK